MKGKKKHAMKGRSTKREINCGAKMKSLSSFSLYHFFSSEEEE
jgi:hypothetical protein